MMTCSAVMYVKIHPKVNKCIQRDYKYILECRMRRKCIFVVVEGR